MNRIGDRNMRKNNQHDLKVVQEFPQRSRWASAQFFLPTGFYVAQMQAMIQTIPQTLTISTKAGGQQRCDAEQKRGRSNMTMGSSR